MQIRSNQLDLPHADSNLGTEHVSFWETECRTTREYFKTIRALCFTTVKGLSGCKDS